MLWGWLGGVLTCAVVGATAACLILWGIIFTPSAASPHSKITAWAIHLTMIHSVKRRAAEAPVLPPPTRAALLSGAVEYERHCIACHGGPGVPRARWVSAMLPTPPFLIDAPARWSRAELYTLVHDGVKMTGMPAWGEIEPDARIADIVVFLEALPKITPERFAAMRRQIDSRHRAPIARTANPATASGGPSAIE